MAQDEPGHCEDDNHVVVRFYVIFLLELKMVKKIFCFLFDFFLENIEKNKVFIMTTGHGLASFRDNEHNNHRKKIFVYFSTATWQAVFI